ncbi:MAG: MarR family transcriptional regulator [Kiritimatiellae bacterium]|nr:MarR family transcriptional regulator [Kiritimatiellia bacterium]
MKDNVVTERVEELVRCMGALARRFGPGRRRSGRVRPFLTRQERHLVEALGEHRLWRVGELARQLEIGGSTLTSLLDRLVEKGIAVRTRAEKDRRVVLVKLTPRGRRRYRGLRLRRLQRARALLESLTEEEQSRFLILLQKVAGIGTGNDREDGEK